MTKLTERLIQNRLWSAWGRVTGTLLVPNYTPVGWYECDLFYVTAAGYMREYEIKLTWDDFVKDREKGSRGVINNRAKGRYYRREDRTKHERLGEGDPEGPRQFWYVVPEGLVHQDKVQDYAGLIWIVGPRRFVRVIKQAPILHQQRVCETVLTHARGVCYYRMWNERMRR